MARFSASLGGKGKSLSRRVGKKKKKGTVMAAPKKRKTALSQVAGTAKKKRKGGLLSAILGGKKGRGLGLFRRGRLGVGTLTRELPGMAGRLMKEARKRKGKQSRK